MPIHFTIDPVLRRVNAVLEGQITEAEIVSYYDALRADPLFEPNFDNFADCRAVDPQPQVKGTFVRSMPQFIPFAPNARHAIVVANPAIFGLARMFQLANKDDSNIEVFQNIEAARAWLEKCAK